MSFVDEIITDSITYDEQEEIKSNDISASRDMDSQDDDTMESISSKPSKHNDKPIVTVLCATIGHETIKEEQYSPSFVTSSEDVEHTEGTASLAIG